MWANADREASHRIAAEDPAGGVLALRGAETPGGAGQARRGTGIGSTWAVLRETGCIQPVGQGDLAS